MCHMFVVSSWIMGMSHLLFTDSLNAYYTPKEGALREVLPVVRYEFGGIWSKNIDQPITFQYDIN